MAPSVWIQLSKKILVGFLLAYSSLLFTLLAYNFAEKPTLQATILMGVTLFFVWVIVGGYTQLHFRKKYFEKITALQKSSILSFTLAASILALIEEAVAVTITNLAPLYGVRLGEAYITASSNYFTVVFFHSVIVFVPMFVTLGWLLKRYTISPFKAFLLFGLVGVFAETMFAGPQAILNAPFWILVYGLMVYLPAHFFIQRERRKFSPFLYPLLIPLIAFSAIATAWIPAVLDMPKTHFAPIETKQ